MSMLAAVLLTVALPQSVIVDSAEVREFEQIADLWKLDDSPTNRLSYPQGMLAAGRSGCVAVGFRIEADGSTSHAQVLELHSDAKRTQRKSFNDAALHWAQRLKYVPVATPTPVYTYEITTFQIDDPQLSVAQEERARAAWKQRCAITDFPARIQALLKP